MTPSGIEPATYRLVAPLGGPDLQKANLNIVVLMRGFPSSCFLKIKANFQSIHLEFPYRHCTRDISGTPLSSTTSDCLPQYLIKRPSRTVAMCGPSDCDRVTVDTRWCATTYFLGGSGILEQSVSGTMVTKRWTDSMASSFP